jgi:hypothetical protein
VMGAADRNAHSLNKVASQDPGGAFGSSSMFSSYAMMKGWRFP